MKFDTSLYTPHPLSKEDQIVVKQLLLEAFENGTGSKKEAVAAIGAFFGEKKFAVSVVNVYADSYWKWFSEWIWDMIGVFPYADIAPALAATCIQAGSSGVFVRHSYVTFLIDHASEFPKLNELHKAIGAQLRVLETPVPAFGDAVFSVKDIAYKVESFEKNIDTVVRAEFLSKLQRVMFPVNSFISKGDQTELVASTVNFIRICLSLDDVEPLARREYNDWLEANELPVDKNVFSALVVKDMSEDVGFGIEEASELIRPLNIIADIIALVGKNPDGSLPTDRVLTEVKLIADLREDQRILDIYYYNESTGTFEWDEKLLKELELVPPDFDMSTIKM